VTFAKKEGTDEKEYYSNEYAALFVARIYERSMEPAELSSYTKVKLDLCEECFQRSLDETLKYKTVAYSNDYVYGFWKYNELKFN